MHPREITTTTGIRLPVRAMTADDLSAVQSIEQRVQFEPWRTAHFASCLEAGHRTLVVVDGKRPDRAVLAYAIASVGAGQADLLNVAVAPECQRQGIARRLLEHLVAHLAPEADTLFLEVRVSNTGAIQLYRRLGFRQVGRRPNYYPAQGGREDALIMALALN